LAHYRRQRTGQDYKLDPFVAIFVSLQILISSYLAVKYSETNPYISLVSVIFIVLTLSGLILHHFFAGGVKLTGMFISPAHRQRVLLMGAVGFFFVLMAQTMVVKFVPSTIILATLLEAKLFYYTAAVSEETFFRYYLQTKVEQVSPFFASAIAIILTSLSFMTYHFGVYGVSIIALYAVFISSLILGVMYWLSKRLSVPMIIHVLVNFFAG